MLELQVEREDDPARLSLLHTRLASLLTSLRGDDVRAMHHYRQAIRLVPSFEPPQQGLLVLAEKHRDDATLVDLLKLRLRHETRPRERAALFSRLGEVIAERLGDATRAEGFLERAVQEHPRALLPRLRLLELLCAQGEFARAEAYARAPDHLELGELDRGHFARLCRLCAWVDRERGRPVHAVRALALALETTERPEGVLDEWLELVRTEAPIRASARDALALGGPLGGVRSGRARGEGVAAVRGERLRLGRARAGRARVPPRDSRSEARPRARRSRPTPRSSRAPGASRRRSRSTSPPRPVAGPSESGR